VWDANCTNCGATVAQWLPGHPGWTPLFDASGRRVANPLGVPGYGQSANGKNGKGDNEEQPGAEPARELDLRRQPRFRQEHTRRRDAAESSAIEGSGEL
jgi:hypothetical protein